MRHNILVSVVVFVGSVFNTAHAVPRYSASVQQVGDSAVKPVATESADAVTAQQVDSKITNEREGLEKEIMVDALKGCRDGATMSSVLDKVSYEQDVCKVQELEVPVNAIKVNSVKSGGGAAKVTAIFDDHRDDENQQISEWNPSVPNVIRVNNALNRDPLSRKIDMFKAILHESRHKWNYENVGKVCKGIGKDECALYDEVMAFMSEGMTKAEAVNHLLEKYPEFVSAIEGAMKMCAKPEMCTVPSKEAEKSATKAIHNKVTETSRDAKVAQDCPAQTKSSSQERTMTDEDVINLLREDGSGIKAAMDALK